MIFWAEVVESRFESRWNEESMSTPVFIDLPIPEQVPKNLKHNMMYYMFVSHRDQMFTARFEIYLNLNDMNLKHLFMGNSNFLKNNFMKLRTNSLEYHPF